MTGSAGQKRVPTDFLSNIKVVVPPIELQNQFADFIKQTDKLKFEVEENIKILDKMSIIIFREGYTRSIFKGVNGFGTYY